MKQEEQDPNKDQVISAIGQIGPWQLKYISMLAASTIFSAVPSLIIKFMAAPNDFVCADVFQDDLGSPIGMAKQVS
jgi:hypothetical protein